MKMKIVAKMLYEITFWIVALLDEFVDEYEALAEQRVGLEAHRVANIGSKLDAGRRRD